MPGERIGYTPPEAQNGIGSAPENNIGGKNVAAIQHELVEARVDELGPDLAAKFARGLVRQALTRLTRGEIVIASPNDPRLEAAKKRTDIFSPVEIEGAIANEYYRNIKETYAPLVTAWAAFALDLKQQIPGSQVVVFPRDGYSFGEAYRVLKVAKGGKNSYHEAHVSRYSLGIKDEIDPRSAHDHEDARTHYQRATQYYQEAIANGTQDRIAIFADSLPYAYMMELVQRGEDSFIVQAGNVGRDWKDNKITPEMAAGLGNVNKTQMLPLALYSHIWGREWPQGSGEKIYAVPGVLNMLVEDYFPQLGIEIPPDYMQKLETICDGVETIFDFHDTVREYRNNGNRIEPVIEPLQSQLSVRLSKEAMKAFHDQAEEATSNNRYRLTEPRALASDQFYADTALHLAKVMTWIDDASQGDVSHGILPQSTAALSKRAAYFNYTKTLQGELFPTIGETRPMLNLHRKPNI